MRGNAVVAAMLLSAGIAGGARAAVSVPVVAPAHTARRMSRHVRLDVDLAFDCSKCVALYAAEPALQHDYGKRLSIVNHYTAATIHAAAPLRLYLVARAAGKGDRAAQLLMSEHLDTRSENEALVLTAWSASQLGLRQAYDASFDQPAMGAEVAHAVRTTGKRVIAGPTVFLNRRVLQTNDEPDVRKALEAALATTPQARTR